MGALSPLYFSPEKVCTSDEVPMTSRGAAPVPVLLAGINPDRLIRQKYWADGREYDWLVIR